MSFHVSVNTGIGSKTRYCRNQASALAFMKKYLSNGMATVSVMDSSGRITRPFFFGQFEPNARAL